MAKDWQIEYHDVETGVKSYGQESLLTLGNGYLGWRGAPVFSQFDDDHYPGLYVAGIFNQTSTKVADRDVINEDMVNLPNPQLIQLKLDGQPVAFKPVARESVLHFDNGQLVENFDLKVPQGTLKLKTVKVVDPTDFHAFAEQVTVTADFAAELEVAGVIDGAILNQNVKRYRAFNSKEFDVVEMTGNQLHARTLSSKIDLVVGAQTEGEGLQFVNDEQPETVVQTATTSLSAGESLTFTRVMAVATSYEADEPNRVVEAGLKKSFAQIQEASANYWQQVWQTADVQIESDDPELQKLVRLNIFHLHQAAQHQANQYLDASVGARALTGEGYRGHIFWDELFFLPYYSGVDPEVAKDLLQYRIKRLAAAKANAVTDGETGAVYPWQSGMTGDEQSQLIHLNPVDNSWIPDKSRFQRHVSLAIVYNLWMYTHLTEDFSVINNGGLAILLETSKFWLNKVELRDGKYHLAGVMGPDEYHEGYPDSEEPGVEDNAYTNVMLSWSLRWLQELHHNSAVDFAQIAQAHDFDDALLAKAEAVADGLALNVSDAGVIEQYRGFFDLKELDFAAYAEKYGDIHRIDRLLKAEGKASDDYQVNKQTDVLMLIYNLGAKKTGELIQQLGYQLPANWLELNHDYYLSRTVHGSTTSRPVFAGIDQRLGREDEAQDFLVDAIKSDYADIQGGTTAEGIHIGVMGETLAVMQNDFAGIDLHQNLLEIDPHIPSNWTKLDFHLRFKGVNYHFIFTNSELTLTADRDAEVRYRDNATKLSQGEPRVFDLAEKG